jgi:hypothetical protein
VVNYEVESSASSVDQLATKFNHVITSGSFTEMLHSKTGTTVTATAVATVVDRTPTSMPTSVPIALEITGSSIGKQELLLKVKYSIIIAVVLNRFIVAF